jgi:putative transposase
MPRPLRPVDDRLVYHVINRGNNRAPVFHDDEDYAAFLRAIGDQKRRRPFELFGYCLMPNHIHLLIRTAGTPISRIMQALLVTHTQRYHRCHRSGGHVWQGRFKSPVVQDDDHLRTVLRYIEANPLRAGMVERAGDYRWSSFAAHGLGRPDDLLDAVVAYEELAATPAVRRRRWSAFVHQAPDEAEVAAVRRSVQTGLPFGEASWVERLGRRLGLDLATRPRGRPRKPAGPTEAQRRPIRRPGPR